MATIWLRSSLGFLMSAALDTTPAKRKTEESEHDAKSPTTPLAVKTAAKPKRTESSFSKFADAPVSFFRRKGWSHGAEWPRLQPWRTSTSAARPPLPVPCMRNPQTDSQTQNKSCFSFPPIKCAFDTSTCTDRYPASTARQ